MTTNPNPRNYTLAFTEQGNPVPVVAENVGPYGSLEEALVDWPGFHEATDDEINAYEAYWDAWYAVKEPGQYGPATTEQVRLLADIEVARS